MLSIMRAAIAEEIAEVVMKELFDDDCFDADTYDKIRRAIADKAKFVLRRCR